jgi:hypothetical protein
MYLACCTVPDISSCLKKEQILSLLISSQTQLLFSSKNDKKQNWEEKIISFSP